MINDQMTVHEAAARKALEEVVRKGEDFQPMLLGFRDGEQIVAVIPPEGDGGTIAAVGSAMCGGLLLDELLLVADTYHSNVVENPLTGKRWEHGEMMAVAQNNNGVAKGWVTDALILSLLQRNGDPEMRVMKYHTVEKLVIWQPTEPMETGEEISGRLTTMMAAPVLELDSREQTDSWALTMLTAAGCLVAWRTES